MNARNGFLSAIGFMQQSARLMGAVPGSSLLCDCRELERKFEAFRLFQYADREMGIAATRPPIHEVVRRTLNQDPFRAIWILEGIGRILGSEASLLVEGLLAEGSGSLVPDEALLPLNTGMGMGFGEKLLGMLGSHPSEGELRGMIQRFIGMCRANCRPGWEDASVEPICLLVRTLHPHLLAPASSAMEAASPGWRRLFWHGVGRGLYFAPTNFLPIHGAHKRMVRGAAAEGDSVDDRRQAIAGLTWAVALVNLEQPGVIRSLLPIGAELGIQMEFTNGVISALLAWRHMAPRDERRLRTYTRPSPAQDGSKDLWETWVETPAREALENVYSGLESRNRIAALYTYRPPEELLELSGVHPKEKT